MRAALAAICAVLLLAGCATGRVPEQAPGPAPAAAPGRVEPPSDAEAPAKDPDIRDGDYWKSYPDNGGRILTAPRRWDRGDWLAAALVAGATGGLLLLDEELRDFWQDDVQGGTSDTASDLFRPFGDTTVTMAASLGAYGLAEAFDAEREQAAALLTLESLVLTSALVAGLKTLSGRDRPEDNDDATEFHGPRRGGIDDAFPSGHASRAFALAATLSEVYGPEHPWVPWLAYPVAAGTALSRVNDDRHWSSDVFLGAALGTAIGKLVVRSSPFLARNGLSLRPFHDNGATGIGLSYRF